MPSCFSILQYSVSVDICLCKLILYRCFSSISFVCKDVIIQTLWFIYSEEFSVANLKSRFKVITMNTLVLL